MLNVFDYEEIPLSLSSSNSVTIKIRGATTKALFNSKPGDLVGIRGPFGKGFTPSKGDVLLVAGGIGIAPLIYLYKHLKTSNCRITVLYGARNAKEIIFKDELKDSLKIATEDGSEGFKGTVVELLNSQTNLKKFNKIYCCGPDEMLREIYHTIKKEGLLDKAEFSLERYMRCGIGICGSCVLNNGRRVCKDGPVFKASKLKSEYE